MAFLLLRVMPSLNQRNARNYSQVAMDEKLPSQIVHARSNAAKPQSCRAEQPVSLVYAGTNGEI